MSGTSLDGLDMALCEFSTEDDNWDFNLVKGETVAYDKDWKTLLSTASGLSATELDKLDVLYGNWLGEQVRYFVESNHLQADFVSSHGHTVLHEPLKRVTHQIGDGPSLSKVCGLPVIYDFRKANVRLGGQGAPLVPIGDLRLFKEYKYCLNLGGIANVSEKAEKSLQALDISICNTAFNYFAQQAGMDYDRAGDFGRSGVPNEAVVSELNSLGYYQMEGPKSLDTSYFYHPILPILENSGLDLRDLAASFYEHVTVQIAKNIGQDGPVLVTGGGAYNDFLIEKLRAKGLNLVIPEKDIIEFKEALVFAFMGVLRLRNEINCLKSVCGGPYDMCLGEKVGFRS